MYVVSIAGTVDRVEDGLPGACVPAPPPPALPAPTGPAQPGTPPAQPGAGDRTPPRVRIRIARHGRVGRQATPRIALTATESCRVSIRARVVGVKLKRVRKPLLAGRRTVVRLRASRSGARRISRAVKRHRRVTLVVSVTATDAAGNVGKVQRRLKVRR